MDELRPEGSRRAVSGGPLDGKPFEVTGYEVWVAWQKVRGNKGAPGVDAVSIAAFEERLEDNLYKVWNRMASGLISRRRCARWRYRRPMGRHENSGGAYRGRSGRADRGRVA